MKTNEKIINAILSDKDIVKQLKDSSVTPEDLIRHATRYIKATREGRMCCIIDKVSASGMSRTLKFMECDGNKKNGFRYYNFYLLFKLMGFEQVKNSDYFRVHGCGMDMVFDSNYRIIHRLHRLGLINRKQCDVLAQKTPNKL